MRSLSLNFCQAFKILQVLYPFNTVSSYILIWMWISLMTSNLICIGVESYNLVCYVHGQVGMKIQSLGDVW